MEYVGPAGNKPKHLCPNTGLEIWKFSNWANPKDINGTEMSEFGPKNNAPGLWKWMSSNPIQQPRLHLYQRTGRFLELDLKIPELYCSRL